MSIKNGKYTMNLYYYTQVLEGESGTATYNGKQYALHHTDSFKSDNTRWCTTKEDHYAITGFTYTNNLPDGSSFEEGANNTYSVAFYYDRNDYNIVFMNKGKQEAAVPKQYGADISGVSCTPTRPEGIPENYQFAGWYDNELAWATPSRSPEPCPPTTSWSTQNGLHRCSPLRLSIRRRSAAKRIPYRRIFLTAAPSARLPLRTRKATRWRVGIPMQHTRSALTSARRSQRISPWYAKWHMTQTYRYTVKYVDENGKEIPETTESLTGRAEHNRHRTGQGKPATSSTMHKARACCSTRTTK